MKRSVAIPFFYLLLIALLFELARMSPFFLLMAYGLTLPCSIFIGLLIPNQLALIPIGIGAIINGAYLYGQLRSRE